jgi:lipoyl(octanoyl) transferase
VAQAVEWAVSGKPVGYAAAVAAMEARAAAIAEGTKPELVWLLEHPPLYTAGTSAKPADLLEPMRFPVHQSGRGGQYTYHGPGQRIAYLMLNLKERGPDLKAYVCGLEAWLIETLAQCQVTAGRRQGRVGVWVEREHGRDDKIAAIGIRVKRWVTLHGISLNVSPDLAAFGGIVPCGFQDHGVTSLADLGRPQSMADVDVLLRSTFETRYGQTVTQAPQCHDHANWHDAHRDPSREETTHA